MKHIRIGLGLVPELVLGLALLMTVTGCAHGPRARPPSQPPNQAMASPPAKHAESNDKTTPTRAPEAPLTTRDLSAHMRDDAPLRYVVKRGDTLWDIAATYLNDPWYWPQLWDANSDIANPHLIYPGEVLVIARGMNGKPRLTRKATVRLSPKVREQPLSDAIPVIPYSAIRDFLESPRLVDDDTLANAPYVVSFDDQHLVAGNGADVYVRGAQSGGPRHYELVRPAGTYRDGKSREILGRKALPVGRITLHERGDTVATATIDKSYREARPGDRLLPLADQNMLRDFYPHAPEEPISADIISVYDGVTEIGQYDVVTLDRGAQQGVQRGDVFDIYKAGRTVSDPVAGGQVSLPEVEAGRLMIFKVADRVSFGLVMHATRAIHVDDVAHSPREAAPM